MQKKKENNIKEILKPLVRKILLENENLPNSPETPGHREEAPKSKTKTMGTGVTKLENIGREVINALKEILAEFENDSLTGSIQEAINDVIYDIIFSNMGPRSPQLARYLNNSAIYNKLANEFEEKVGFNIDSMINPDVVQAMWDSTLD